MKKRLSTYFSLLTASALLISLAACGSGSSSSASGSASEVSASETAIQAEETTQASQETATPSAASAASAIEEESSAAEASAEEESGEVVLEEVALPIEDTAVHYSCWMPVAPYVSSLINLDDFSNEIAMVKNISELTNVWVDYTAVAGGMEEETTFNLMIAGGDYTDIIGVMNYYTTGHEGAIRDGIIVDLYDALQEYCPNYWNTLTADDEAYMTMRTDSGYMGCIAQLYKEKGLENMGPIIRKDWLDAAGMDVPETMDDLEAYLTWCKDNYGAYCYLQYEGNDTDLGSGFNITPNGYIVQDGKLIHAYETQGYQDYLAKMHDWYEKGLFDGDFYNSTDITTVRQDMANDLCSYVDGSAESMSNIFDMNPDNASMALMAIPYAKADGVDEVHVGYSASLIKNSDTWAISTECDDYVPLLKLVNYLYSEEGQLIYNWGEEGVSYTLDADGNPQWTDLVVNNPDGLNFMFASYLYASGVGSVFYPGVYDMRKGFYSYNEDQLAAVDTLANLTDGAYTLPRYVSLTTEEQTEYNSYATDLETYADSMILKFIMGDEPLTGYDTFLSTVKEMGLDKMTEIEQAAYDRAQEVLESA